jgi:hypothetical protein
LLHLHKASYIFTSGMKPKSRKVNGSNGKSYVCKTISGPPELFAAAEAIVTATPDLDFSKYVRRLIRKDLEAAKAKEAA